MCTSSTIPTLDDAGTEDDYTIREWVDAPGVRYVPVDGELEVLPGLRLVPAPGHTRGLPTVAGCVPGRWLNGPEPVVVGNLSGPHCPSGPTSAWPAVWCLIGTTTRR
jgi:N-acyl homoserine lactone hydrolase